MRSWLKLALVRAVVAILVAGVGFVALGLSSAAATTSCGATRCDYDVGADPAFLPGDSSERSYQHSGHDSKPREERLANPSLGIMTRVRPALDSVAPSGTGLVDEVAGTASRFSIHDRVAGQLNDPRLGNLRGRFGTDDLQALTTSPNATAYLDVRSGHINVIQEIDGVLLRITTAADEFWIISVGRVRPAQLTNGSMIPIGSGG